MTHHMTTLIAGLAVSMWLFSFQGDKDEAVHHLICEANANVQAHSDSHGEVELQQGEVELQQSQSKEVGHGYSSARRLLRTLGLMLGSAALLFTLTMEFVRLYGHANTNEMLEPLLEARRLAQAACREMEMDYGTEDAQKLLKSLHFRNRDFVKKKIVRAILKENRFVISFAGTSVTAGHDNLFEESYPMVFARILKPAFDAAKVDLVVRNHAMGNQPAIPASFCVGAQLGEDADVAVWEFGMMVPGIFMLTHIELWLRNALNLSRRPALMFLDPGEGARPYDDNGNLPTEPRSGEPGNWGDTFGALLEHYEAFGPHTQAMYEAVWSLDHLDRYNFDALVRPWTGWCLRLRLSLSSAISITKRIHLCTQVSTGKSSPHPARWHPGPGGHELRGRILAYHYLQLLDDALVDAYYARSVDLLRGGKMRAEQDKLVAAADADAVIPVPKPLDCDPVVCKAPMKCAMTYEPRTAGWGLQELLVQAPEAAKTAEPTLEAGNNTEWHVQLYGPDHEAVVFALENHYGYLDRKYVLQGNKDAGSLTLRVTTSTRQHLYFCQPPGVWGGTPEDQSDLDVGTEVRIDGAVVKLLGHDDPFYGKHKLGTVVCFATDNSVPAGNHEVIVTPTDAEGKYVALSVVVWY